MRISVAMATWNGERFLSQQLSSIARQTRLPDHLVISDDASDDSTLEIVDRFAAEAPLEVVVLRNRSRVGFVENFLRAMRACTGDAIALADQDDVWHPHKLEWCERPLIDDRDVVMAVHSAQAVDEYLRPVPADPGASGVRTRALLPPGSLAPFPAAWSGCTIVFRAAIVTQAPPEALPRQHEVSDPMFHDQWLTIVGSALGRVALLPDVLLSYRRHASTATEAWTGHHSVPVAVRRSQRTMALWRWSTTLHSAVAQSDEVAGYSRRAERTRVRLARLTLLGPLAASIGPTAVAGLQRSIAAYEQYAAALEHRADVYADRRRLARAVHIGRNFSRGDYRARVAGGLGRASLARDLTLALIR